MNLSAKLFLESGEDYVLGPGRIELLRSVAELGSLRKAAQRLGMSYRWAWGRLKDAEKALGVPLLTADTTGKAKILSREAIALLSWFERTENAVSGLLAQADAERPDFLDRKEKSTPPGCPAAPTKANRTPLD